jgi:adenine-specific DNA-methyltransferase
LAWQRFESDPLEVDAPPIYIQEKILPRAIIEDLRRQTKERRVDDASQFDFFHDFNGLADPEAKTEFYAHDQNWSNRMILGDSLLVMASLAEREGLRGKIQCIYFDPPYGIKFNSNWQPSTKSRDVKEGRDESVTREPEVIRAFRDTWKDGLHTYLPYLRDRLVVARDLLTETASIFVQISEENLHHIRELMDEIFGADNHCVTITFRSSISQTSHLLPEVCNYIVCYAKDINQAKYRPIYRYKEPGEEGATTYTQMELLDGSRRKLSDVEIASPSTLPQGARVFSTGAITQRGQLRQTTPQGLHRLEVAELSMSVTRSGTCVI